MVKILLTTYDKETIGMFLLGMVIFTACILLIIVVSYDIMTDIQDRREEIRKKRMEESYIKHKDKGEKVRLEVTENGEEILEKVVSIKDTIKREDKNE